MLTSAETTVASSTIPSTTMPERGVRLGYELTAQTELVSPEGVHVLIDVTDPTKLVEPVTDQDILLTSHDHPDHVNQDFQTAFAGQQLFMREGQITSRDVTVRSIATVHDEALPIGTDYLFVIDIGELRVVHFGDIGLSTLPPDLLVAVGSIDVAITQFANSYSGVDATNGKAFNLMAQLTPRLIIPTHQSDASVAKMSRWPCLYTERPMVTLTRDRLTPNTRVLFMGPYAKAYGATTKASPVEW
jgi:L-ascorbate metabolism protein UlaG (beta-lactamase superfamily)